jgi:hypothetical protein
MIGRLEAAIAEIGDLLFYCNDIMSSGIPGLNELMSKHVLDLLLKPVLVPALCPDRQSDADTGVTTTPCPDIHMIEYKYLTA